MSIWQKLPQPFFCLAPMEGAADTYFRQVVAKAAKPDLMFTEFTSVEGMASRGFEAVTGRLQYNPIEQPLVAQIWGLKPDNFFRAAKIIKSLGFAGIDINMGCPDKAVVKKGGGAALIDNQALASQIIVATQSGAGGLPVSVKTRIGRQEMETEKWVTFLLKTNIDALTLHARTEAEKSAVPAHWEEVQVAVNLRNKINKKIRVIGNGDIISRQEGIEAVKQYGVDGIMIGRGALKNPWVFSKQAHIKISKKERLDKLRLHLELGKERDDRQNQVLIMRKYYRSYLKGFPGAKKTRDKLMTLTKYEEVIKELEGLT